MTSRKRGAPMTAAKLRLWLVKHAPAIEQKQDQRLKQISDAAADCVHRALRDCGLTLDSAGDDLLQRFPYGAPGGRPAWTPAELKGALEALGWQPKRRRRNGGAA